MLRVRSHSFLRSFSFSLRPFSPLLSSSTTAPIDIISSSSFRRSVATSRVWGPGEDAAEESLLLGRVPVIKGAVTKEERWSLRNKAIPFDVSNFPLFREMRLGGQVWSKIKFKRPSPIQVAAVPYMKENLSRGVPTDLIIQDMTGGGKTLAYLLPIVEKVNNLKAETQAVIMVPSRELAVQTISEVRKLTSGGKLRRKQYPIRSFLCCGLPNGKMITFLKTYPPHIVVGTPDTLRSLFMPTNRAQANHKSKALLGTHVKFFVIDEIDEMLKSDSRSSTMDLLEKFQASRRSKTPERCCLMLVSAFFSQQATEIIQKYMYRPHTASCFGIERTDLATLNHRILPPDLIHLYTMFQDKSERLDLTYTLFRALKPRLLILFLNNTNNVKEIASFFMKKNLRVKALVGAANKIERKEANDAVSAGKVDILITSGMGSRGLNFAKATHVINFDVPETFADYLHRAGRLGRYGLFKHGIVVTLIHDPKAAQTRKLELAAVTQKYLAEKRAAKEGKFDSENRENTESELGVVSSRDNSSSGDHHSRSNENVSISHESENQISTSEAQENSSSSSSDSTSTSPASSSSPPSSISPSSPPPFPGKNAAKKLKRAVLGEIVTLSGYAKQLGIRVNPVRANEGRIQKGLVNAHGEVTWIGSYLDEEIERRKRVDEEKSEKTRKPAPAKEPEDLAHQSLLWRSAFDPYGGIPVDSNTSRSARTAVSSSRRRVSERDEGTKYNQYQPRQEE